MKLYRGDYAVFPHDISAAFRCFPNKKGVIPPSFANTRIGLAEPGAIATIVWVHSSSFRIEEFQSIQLNSVLS